MSFLDKLNESVSEPNDNDDLYETQYEELQIQLNKANQTNKKNIEEINQLKNIINQYTTQLSNLKVSYNQNIEELKSQLYFEKEINERYLKKIIESSNALNKEFKSFNDKTTENNKSISYLVNNNEELSNSTNKIISEISNINTDSKNESNLNEINKLNESIENNNKELLSLISQIKEDHTNESSQILNKIVNQENLFKNSGSDTLNQIKELINNNKEEIIKHTTQKSESESNVSVDEIDHLKEIISNNNKEILSAVSQIKEEQNSVNAQILEKINNQLINTNENNNTEHLDQIKELICSNKDEIIKLNNLSKESHENTASKIINELSNNTNENVSNDILSKLQETIKSNNDEIINALHNNNNTDITKIEIFNKICDDLKNENYVNLEAYKKIKDMKLFDEVFYKRTYNYNLDIDPLLHFIYKGYEENKRPRKDFVPLVYKRSDKNIEESNLNPLVYFVTKGIHEGNVKINDNMPELKYINKYEIDKEIDLFTIRGVKKSKRKPRIIVSLTSIPERMYDVHYTLYSLLNQEVKPDKVILWLSKDDFPNGEIDLPKNVLKLKRNGLSLRFCEDISSYKKIIPALQSYPKDIIVTADDDIYYPSNWLKILYEDYKQNNDMIIAQRVRKINFDEEYNIQEYNSWLLSEDEGDVSYFNFPTSGAGVLYPPNSLYEDVSNIDLFTELCESADDIWLWAMAVLNHKKIKIANNKLDSSLIYVNPARDRNLTNEPILGNDNVIRGHNNIKIKNVLEKYPEIINIIKNEE